MNHPSAIPPVRSPLAALACGGLSLLLFCTGPAPLAAAPPSGEPSPAAAVVAEADRLANTDKGIAYREACNPLLVKAVQKALHGLEKPPRGKFLCDFVVVVGADGHVTNAIVANDAFSIRLTDELRKMTLPNPPRDGWPLGIRWELDLRQKSK